MRISPSSRNSIPSTRRLTDCGSRASGRLSSAWRTWSAVILQLLTVVWPYLERLSKEGELGRRKITQYTRYLTLALAAVQSLGIAIWLERNTDIPGGLPLVYDPGWGFRLGCILTLTTGTMFIMWLGEQITERGIGNGMSLIIFAGIVVGLPGAAIATFDQMQTGQMSLLVVALLDGALGLPKGGTFSRPIALSLFLSALKALRLLSGVPGL